jgi:hypothetical protein
LKFEARSRRLKPPKALKLTRSDLSQFPEKAFRSRLPEVFTNRPADCISPELGKDRWHNSGRETLHSRMEFWDERILGRRNGCRGLIRERFFLTITARERLARAARDAGAPNAPGLRVQKVEKHTDIDRHREHAGEPTSRAPECLGLLRISPVDIPPPLWSSASSASLSGEFGGGSARTP